MRTWLHWRAIQVENGITSNRRDAKGALRIDFDCTAEFGSRGANAKGDVFHDFSQVLKHAHADLEVFNALDKFRMKHEAFLIYSATKKGNFREKYGAFQQKKSVPEFMHSA